MEFNKTQKAVQDYYGKELKSSEDLKTNACCTIKSYAPHIRKAMSRVHEEVQSKYYGCGLCLPECLDGCHVLDLGSGSGRDCYIAAQLVGEQGSVVGVDMTDVQLEVARKHVEFHVKNFAYSKSNVTFLKGDIEKLEVIPELKDNFFDVIISNCVINLASDKRNVLLQAFKKLKTGGELYFSDVYADRRIPSELAADPVLFGECLSGAMYIYDFLSLAKSVGFSDPRRMESAPITVKNKDLEEKVGAIQFRSETFRLIKLPELDERCEDYGQAIRYRGNLAASPQAFVLDEGHVFENGRTTPVCRNTFRMLKETRFESYFEFIGDDSVHLGLFQDCAPKSSTKTASSSGASCC